MEHRREVVAAAAYIAAMLVFIYGIVNPDAGGGAVVSVVLVTLVVVHVGLGWWGRSWWLVLLPVVGVALAVPAGLPETDGGEPFPIWFGLTLFYVIPGAALIEFGLLGSRFRERRRARRRRAQG